MIKEVVRKFLFIGSYCTGFNVQDFFEQIEQGFEIRSRVTLGLFSMHPFNNNSSCNCNHKN